MRSMGYLYIGFVCCHVAILALADVKQGVYAVPGWGNVGKNETYAEW